MPKFDGKSLGGDLQYDFTDYGHPNIVGTVPEPSRFTAKKFFKDVQQTMKKLQLVDEDAGESASPDGIVQVMNSIDDEEMFDKLTEGITDALAELCGGKKSPKPGIHDEETYPWVWTGGSPTHEQLTALGYRPFMGFFGYLMSNLMNPELQAPGTNSSPRMLRSV